MNNYLLNFHLLWILILVYIIISSNKNKKILYTRDYFKNDLI